MDEEAIKCENIDNIKGDLSIIDQFEQIYSNFMVVKHSPKIPKIIKDEEPSPILKMNDEESLLDEKNLSDENLENLIMKKPSSEINKNKNKKLIKNLIESNNRIISNKKNENKKEEFKNGKIENNKINIKEENEIKKKERKIKIQNIIEKMKQNRKKNIKSKEKINKTKVKNNDKNNDKSKEKTGMKEIYKYLYEITDDNNISIYRDKKYNIKSAHERLYNQGFYSKNKSQINILENINKIKKDSNYNNITQKSKELLGLNNNKINKKYDKNNIYKPIQLNIKNKNKSTELLFHPEINENTLRITKNMEKPFIRLTKPKNKMKVETPKKIFTKKEEYEKCIKRINSLYLDGVEKLKKKKLKSSTPTPTHIEEKKIDIKNINFNLKSINKKNNRNIYYQQIQWKKKIIFENMKRKKIYDNYDKCECTFRPETLKRNISKLFKKQLSEADIIKRKNKNYYDIYFGPKIKEFNVSKQRYFIINNDDIKSNNNSFYSKINKNCESEKRYRYNDNNIKIGLIKRKLYNLEKFFSKKNI